MNEPIFKKSEPHGFDNRPIEWKHFLKLYNAAQVSADNIGYPVYLVGSSLYKEIPRDIDVCVIIPLSEYEQMFGRLPNKQNEYANYLGNIINETFDKISELHFCLIETHHIDVKVYPDTWFTDRQKLLLATPNIIKI